MRNVVKITLLFIGIVLASVVWAQKLVTVYKDPTKTIVVHSAYPQFMISQKANPTTGYNWKLVYYDNQAIQLVNSIYQPSVHHLLGSGGNMVWVFQVMPNAFVQPTTTQIKLVYERSFALQDNPTNVVFTVVTKP